MCNIISFYLWAKSYKEGRCLTTSSGHQLEIYCIQTKASILLGFFTDTTNICKNSCAIWQGICCVTSSSSGRFPACAGSTFQMLKHHIAWSSMSSGRRWTICMLLSTVSCLVTHGAAKHRFSCGKPLWLQLKVPLWRYVHASEASFPSSLLLMLHLVAVGQYHLRHGRSVVWLVVQQTPHQILQMFMQPWLCM